MCIEMTRPITYSQAISEATVQAMEADGNVVVLGLGVEDFKGIFGTTVEAFQKFGPERVIGTPASEGALTGICIGLALNGKRPIIVHARNDFMFLTLDQMFNNAAKWKYSYGGKSSVPFVARGIVGRGWGQGPTHSQSIQSLFAHFPGLYVAMPSSPYIAKGLLMKSLEIDTPVVFIEHRRLYDIEEHVPQEPYTVEFGQARVFRPGEDVTIVATSIMVREALKAAQILEDDGISAEVIDPVSLRPLDEETILTSVRKTGRLICADNAWQTCGFASEVAALAAEKAFAALKAPVKRITWPDCPCPVSLPLEEAFYPGREDIINAAYQMMEINKTYQPDQKAETNVFLGPY